MLRMEYTPHKDFVRVRFIVYCEPTPEGEADVGFPEDPG